MVNALSPLLSPHYLELPDDAWLNMCGNVLKVWFRYERQHLGDGVVTLMDVLLSENRLTLPQLAMYLSDQQVDDCLRTIQSEDI